MIKPSWQLPTVLLIASTGLLCCAATAHAHPHLWITTKVTVLYEKVVAARAQGLSAAEEEKLILAVIFRI